MNQEKEETMSPHAMYWGIPAPGEDLYCCPECGHLWEDEENAHFSTCCLFATNVEREEDEANEELVAEECAVAAY